ncbi:MFS transporter [Nonomuraea terrae]|uniref:MFS transporter n=1 Tax=Nonomuraea terrae TaxID=2530383 RepID=A0A4R4XCY0_9ACTN|nr:MFS transporter [Nonomuraea terrae]TDD28513.1 MFS transporter [Nonomuraea terrae]
MATILGGGRRLLLAVVCAVAVANVYAVQPVLDAVGSDLGLTSGGLGWLVAVGQAGYLAGLVTLVPLGDVLDRRRLIAGHLVLTAAGSAVVAASTTAPLALAGLGVAGMFAVVVQTTVAYTAAVSPPHERGRNIGTVTSGVVVGILGARVMSGFLAEAAGWRSVYATLAAASMVLAGLVMISLPPDESREGAHGGYRQVIASMGSLVAADRMFRSRAALAFFVFASFGTLWSGLALPLSAEPWHLTPAQIGLFALAGLAGALGAARAGRWADRGYAGPVTGWALVVLIVSWTFTACTGQSLWLLSAGVILLDLAVQAVHVSNQHLITTARPRQAGGVIGAYMAFYSLGSALGAVTTAWTYATAGWPAACLLGAGYATAALAVWALSPRPRPPGAAPHQPPECLSCPSPIRAPRGVE